MRRSLAAGSLVLLLSGAALAGPPAPEGERVCRFADPRIAESSGVVASSRSDSALWTHNDSGDTGRFFLVDTPSCRTLASYALALPPSVQEPTSGESANNLDLEDVARSRTPDGTPTLLLADVGDNQQVRGAHTVYEVAEPDGAVADPGVEQPVPPLAVHAFAYPGQPWDAEAVAALPDRRLVVVTKPRSTPDLAYTGRSEVYVSLQPMASAGADLLVLRKVADLDLRALTGQAGGDAVAVTAADLAADGSRFALRTYTTAFVWRVGRGADLGAALVADPAVVPLLPVKQGEGLAFARSGRALWTSSEGSGLSDDPASGVVDRYELGPVRGPR